MDINYNAYNPDNIDSLIQVDNLIYKIRLEIKDLKEEKKTIPNDPQRLKEINERIQRKEIDLKRYIQERNDILRGYE